MQSSIITKQCLLVMGSTLGIAEGEYKALSRGLKFLSVCRITSCMLVVSVLAKLKMNLWK